MYIYSISFNSVLKKAKSDVFLSSSERERDDWNCSRRQVTRLTWLHLSTARRVTHSVTWMNQLCVYTCSRIAVLDFIGWRKIEVARKTDLQRSSRLFVASFLRFRLDFDMRCALFRIDKDLSSCKDAIV